MQLYIAIMLCNFNWVIQLSFIKHLPQQSETFDVQEIRHKQNYSPLHSGHLFYTDTMQYLY